ncbi:MAG: hypothetical protein ACI9MR_001223 [Myxococcota bacterium]|jgi:hypothetical protein
MQTQFTAFAGHTKVAAGSLADITTHAHAHLGEGHAERLLVFADAGGTAVDLDLSGTVAQAITRLAGHPIYGTAATAPRPGRPRLGVVSREISLLPRHWAWLSRQPRSASATLRRLIDDALRQGAGTEAARLGREHAHRFLWSMAGDLPGFEEVARTLDRGDLGAFEASMATWPEDVRTYAVTLAAGEHVSNATAA